MSGRPHTAAAPGLEPAGAVHVRPDGHEVARWATPDATPCPGCGLARAVAYPPGPHRRDRAHRRAPQPLRSTPSRKASRSGATAILPPPRGTVMLCGRGTTAGLRRAAG